MDAATVVVLVATILFVGFIVWVNVYARREAEHRNPATSDGNTKTIAEKSESDYRNEKKKRR
jgi:hypothetical protein